jgi:hypothetical protein
VAADPAHDRVYFLSVQTSTSIKITAYDTRSFIQVGSLTVPNIMSSDAVVRNFIFFGADGLALNTSDGKIHFVSTSLITPLNPTPLPTPILVTPEVKQIPLSTGDLVYSRSDGMIYATVPSRVDGFGAPISFGNSIVPINPLAATFGQPVPVGSEPRTGRSGDGQYLYAADAEGAVSRLNIASHTRESKFAQ